VLLSSSFGECAKLVLVGKHKCIYSRNKKSSRVRSKTKPTLKLPRERNTVLPQKHTCEGFFFAFARERITARGNKIFDKQTESEVWASVCVICITFLLDTSPHTPHAHTSDSVCLSNILFPRAVMRSRANAKKKPSHVCFWGNTVFLSLGNFSVGLVLLLTRELFLFLLYIYLCFPTKTNFAHSPKDELNSTVYLKLVLIFDP
jgi:hypothetical protein